MSAIEKLFWFRCPICETVGDIDHEQATGLVSILCDPPCQFHAKVIVSPLIPSEEPLPPDIHFIIREA